MRSVSIRPSRVVVGRDALARICAAILVQRARCQQQREDDAERECGQRVLGFEAMGCHDAWRACRALFLFLSGSLQNIAVTGPFLVRCGFAFPRGRIASGIIPPIPCAGLKPSGCRQAAKRARKTMNSLELTGRSRSHVVDLTEPPCATSRATRSPLMSPCVSGRALAGHDLVPVSEVSRLRSPGAHLERQVPRRATDASRRRPTARCGTMSDAREGRCDPAVVRACPARAGIIGAREIDVIDRAALAAGYQPQLMPVEYQPGGPFAALNDWLDAYMAALRFLSSVSHGSRRRAPGALAPELRAGVRAGATAVTPEVLWRRSSPRTILGRKSCARGWSRFTRATSLGGRTLTRVSAAVSSLPRARGQLGKRPQEVSGKPALPAPRACGIPLARRRACAPRRGARG